MADTGRRRVGPPPTAAGVRSPPRYLPQQQPQAQQQQRFAPQRTPKTPPVNSKMGIKSGMTVEDLKRLTQQRMQQSSGNEPATPTASQSSAVPTPTLNVAAVHAHTAPPNAVPTPTALAPKAGMSVQELKQLTSLRLASQNVPLHQSEITGLVSKAVLSNAAKSHYRDSLRGSLTPSTTPKRTSMTTPVRSSMRGGHEVSSPTMDDHMYAGRHSLPSRPMGIPSMRGGSDLDHHAHRSSDFGLNQVRYSYSGPDDFNGFDDSGSDVSDDEYTRPSLDLDDDAKYGFEDQFNPSRPFAEDSFPPPPPLDDTGRFVATSLPSWSPPPVRSKKLDAAAQPLSFYSQPSYFAQQQQADTSRDQNAVIAPPPGLTRRPSMTVPWQVAEAVLNTPQTTTGRKTVVSPTHSNDAVSSNMFAVPHKDRGAGLKSPAAELAAEMSAIALGRQRSGSGAPPPAPNVASSAMLGTSPPGNGSAGARRGSFGNAAEFFKFRRRSKSRLELARDISSSYGSDAGGGFPNYGATATSAAPPSATGKSMPGIDESRADFRDNFSVVTNADTNSVASHDESAPSPGYSQAGDEYEDSEGGGSFVSFYNAAGVGRNNRDGFGSNLSSLSIPPPPPPPPMTDDEDDASTTSSTKGLPMMSPNGVRLRKVAEMARRGSLSSEDKTRAKDEIIQSSLGIGASHAARILTAKPSNGTPVAGPAPAPSGPPPGFQRLVSATPPRDTPKATATKSIPSGIVRSSTPAGGIVARSPPKPLSMLSPTSVGRKTLGSGGSPPKPSESRSIEERLAAAAQRVADCAGKGDMVGFQSAMAELDVLRNEANAMLPRA